MSGGLYSCLVNWNLCESEIKSTMLDLLHEGIIQISLISLRSILFHSTQGLSWLEFQFSYMLDLKGIFHLVFSLCKSSQTCSDRGSFTIPHHLEWKDESFTLSDSQILWFILIEIETSLYLVKLKVVL